MGAESEQVGAQQKVQISSPVKSNDVQWPPVNAHRSMAKDEAVTLSRLVARCSDEVI